MTTVICPKCGTENPGGAANCSKCRIILKLALEHAKKQESIEPNQMKVRICPQCNTHNDENINNPMDLNDLYESGTDREEDDFVPMDSNTFSRIIKTYLRVVRALRLDASLYDELKEDPQASSDGFKLVLFLSLLNALSGVIQNGYQVFAGWFVSFLIIYYIFVSFTWLIGVIFTRKLDSFVEVQTALAYAYSPFLFFGLPSPWFLPFFWGFITFFFAIRRSLGIPIVLTIIILIGASFLETYLRPLVFPWIMYLFFDWIYKLE